MVGYSEIYAIDLCKNCFYGNSKQTVEMNMGSVLLDDLHMNPVLLGLKDLRKGLRIFYVDLT
jgi:hypothetical protein